MSDYGTLRLDAPVAQKKSRKLAYLAIAFALVGLAATAAVVGSVQVKSAIFAKSYDAKAGDIEYCDKNSEGYLERLPKYDAEMSATADFYNACYHGFRCCTTTGNGDGCYVSDNFGPKCRNCLTSHPPMVLKETCKQYIIDYEASKKELEKPAEEQDATKIMMADEAFTTKEMMANGTPPFKTREQKKSVFYANNYAVVLQEGFKCWVEPGTNGDKRPAKFGENCFEVLSWCNLLCPRDTANSGGHIMCKHCALLGFERGKPTAAIQV